MPDYFHNFWNYMHIASALDFMLWILKAPISLLLKTVKIHKNESVGRCRKRGLNLEQPESRCCIMLVSSLRTLQVPAPRCINFLSLVLTFHRFRIFYSHLCTAFPPNFLPSSFQLFFLISIAAPCHFLSVELFETCATVLHVIPWISRTFRVREFTQVKLYEARWAGS